MSNAKIKIEKGIPIPTSMAYKKIPFPFADMEVGDSFSISLSEDVVRIGKKEVTRNSATHFLRERCRQFRDRPGNADKKFTIREIKEEGIARCWRTA